MSPQPHKFHLHTRASSQNYVKNTGRPLLHMTRIASIQSENAAFKHPVVLYGHAKKISFLSDRTQIRFSQRTLVQFCKQFTELFISVKVCSVCWDQCTGEGVRRSQVPYSMERTAILIEFTCLCYLGNAQH